MILPIYLYGQPVLRKQAEEIENTPELKQFIADMYETLTQAEGCGLAAPQVGVTKRIIVVDDNPSDDDKSARNPMYLINPEIIWRSEEKVLFNEGCLSLPQQRAEVERHERVRVHFIDYNGDEQEILADDLLAIILQHEIDHLDGILYIDHLSRLKRMRLLNKLNKYREDKDHCHKKD